MEPMRVIITTEFRGVFYGKLTEYDRATRTAVLEDTCNVIYWPAATQGFAGLATFGPLEEARLGARVPRIELLAVTSIVPCTDEAVAKFEAVK